MSTQNTTAYIPTPISKPPTEDGLYLMMFPDGIFSNQMYMFQNGKWATRVNDSKYSHWLKPIDLTVLLWQVWNAAETRQQQVVYCNTYGGEPDAPDRGPFCDSILNPK